MVNPKLSPASDELSRDVRDIEARLLQAPAVEACAVLARRTESGAPFVVAYVVAPSLVSSERLREHLAVVDAGGVMPDAYVLVNHLPLTEGGDIDEPALASLEVIDDTVLEGWRQELSSVPAVDRVAVMVEQRSPERPPVHLDDVLPDWRGGTPGAPIRVPTAPQGADAVALAPAIADGGPLDVPPDAPTTLTEALARAAVEHRDHGVTYVQGASPEFQSYQALFDEAKHMLGGLQAAGVQPSRRIVLQVDSLRDFCTAFWACILGGFSPVPVAVAPSYDENNAIANKLLSACRLLGDPIVLASPHLVEPITALLQRSTAGGIGVLSIADVKGHPPGRIYRARPDDVLFLQLTSGSTAVPKCIQITHRGVVSHIHASQQFNGYTSDDVVLNWLPMDHVGSTLMVHLRCVYLGCTHLHVRTDLILSNPLSWLDLLEQHRVSHTWSPNFGYKLVADQLAAAPECRWDLARMKFFMNGGEQVTLPVIQEFLERTAEFGVREHMLQPTFGMAEACTCTTYQNRFSCERGVRRFAKDSLSGQLREADSDDPTAATFLSLGPPIPGIQLRIVDADNNLLPEGRIGRYQIKGPMVTPGYLNNDEANAEAFVGDGWFNSGDLGFILDGQLVVTGREKETIIIRGANFYCHEIEDVVNAIDGVEPTFAAACAVEDARAGTEALAVFFASRADRVVDLPQLVKTIRARVAGALGIHPSFVVPLSTDEFPKTTSGKIQRVQLKRSLEGGMFDRLLKELDVELRDENTIPQWFYRRSWRRRTIRVRRLSKPQDALVFVDGQGLGHVIAEHLGQRDGHCAIVESGPGFARLSRGRYRVDPAQPGDYLRLLDQAEQDGFRCADIVHLWTYEDEADQQNTLEAIERRQRLGAHSLMFLVQALAQWHSGTDSCRVLAVSSRLQCVEPGDHVACGKSTLLGLVHTAGQELPWLDCRHLDIAPAAAGVNSRIVLDELETADRDSEVAYRHGSRWVIRLEQWDPRNSNGSPSPFRLGGAYLLTGGMGGVGRHIAEHLLKTYGARLLIVGRSQRPEETAYRALQRLPGDVMYVAADVCDQEQLQAAVSQARDCWETGLDGVIHLAGMYAPRTLLEETAETFDGTLRAKVQGSWNLHQLSTNSPNCLFITFSSVNGHFGGYGAAAYAAASAFLDNLSLYRRNECGLCSSCVAWSMWDELGMSRDFELKELSRSQGYHAIAAERGLQSFEVALRGGEPHLLIGLDDSGPRVQPQVAVQLETRLGLRAFYTALDGTWTAEKLTGIQVSDRTGRPTQCAFARLDSMPLTPGGTVDHQRLLGGDGAAPPGGRAPSRLVEREVADIWRQVLKVSELTLSDNFFALGGNSLLAAQVVSRLRDRFQVDLTLRCLLDNPSLLDLSAALESILVRELDGAPSR